LTVTTCACKHRVLTLAAADNALANKTERSLKRRKKKEKH
jgi:hypothetical protein